MFNYQNTETGEQVVLSMPKNCLKYASSVIPANSEQKINS